MNVFQDGCTAALKPGGVSNDLPLGLLDDIYLFIDQFYSYWWGWRFINRNRIENNV